MFRFVLRPFWCDQNSLVSSDTGIIQNFVITVSIVANFDLTLSLQTEERIVVSVAIESLLGARAHPLLMDKDRLRIQDDELHLCFWPIDNTECDDEGVQAYKQTLLDLCKESPMASLIEPVSFIRLRDLVSELSSDSTATESKACQALRRRCGNPEGKLDHVPLDELRDLYRRCLFKGSTFDEENFRNAVKLLHDHGIVTYYDDVGLVDLVILNPAWLLETLSYIIRDPEKQPYMVDRHLQADQRDQLFERGIGCSL